MAAPRNIRSAHEARLRIEEAMDDDALPEVRAKRQTRERCRRKIQKALYEDPTIDTPWLVFSTTPYNISGMELLELFDEVKMNFESFKEDMSRLL